MTPLRPSRPMANCSTKACTGASLLPLCFQPQLIHREQLRTQPPYTKPTCLSHRKITESYAFTSPLTTICLRTKFADCPMMPQFLIHRSQQIGRGSGIAGMRRHMCVRCQDSAGYTAHRILIAAGLAYLNTNEAIATAGRISALANTSMGCSNIIGQNLAPRIFWLRRQSGKSFGGLRQNFPYLDEWRRPHLCQRVTRIMSRLMAVSGSRPT